MKSIPDFEALGREHLIDFAHFITDMWDSADANAAQDVWEFMYDKIDEYIENDGVVNWIEAPNA